MVRGATKGGPDDGGYWGQLREPVTVPSPALHAGRPHGRCEGRLWGRSKCGLRWGAGVGRRPQWASVVLEEREEVIIAIAGQVRGVQVREELVRVGELWKEIQRRLRHVGRSLCSGLTL